MALKHISGWVQVTEPSGPVDPGWGGGWGGWSPADPGYGIPGGGGHPSTGPIYGGGHPSTGPIKPPGRPVLPANPIYKPPPGHPWLPGRWEPIDPGYGKPPLWGFIPVDPGFGIDVGGKPPVDPGYGQGGVWVPTDPDYGMPVRPCPGDGVPHPPLWAWIPDRPTFPDNSLPGGKPTPSPVHTTIYPTAVTPPAAGGSGSVNITTDPAGSWYVDAASVPAWVTVNPMGSQTSDVNLTYTAAPNTTKAARTATIKVNDASFAINQSA